MKLIFYASSSGRSYIADFLSELQPDDQASILAVFADIEEHGTAALGCSFRQIEGRLWEVRIETRRAGYRFFYILMSGPTMVVLHAYKKQGRKAPLRALDLARKRMKEVLK